MTVVPGFFILIIIAYSPFCRLHVTEATEGVVYEKSENAENSTTKTPYSVNKMSKEDRAALIQQLKADEASRQAQLTDIVKKMMTEQATSYANATDRNYFYNAWY